MKICLVEDDLKLGGVLQSALQNAGQEVTWVRRAADARYWIDEDVFDVIVLDIGLPDASGMDLLREIRSHGRASSVVLVTARDSLDDRIKGLDSGADDYLVKPFATDELLARLRAVVRRVAGTGLSGEPVWSVRDLVLNERARLVTRSGVPVNLSKTEFALLHTLLRQPDRVWTRRELEAQALPDTDAQALDVHIYNLRRKLGGEYVHTVRGIGYVVRK
ncbi:MAG: response regulator transcription factor [Telluria sp.]